MTITKLVGTGMNQVPTNGMLGDLAFMRSEDLVLGSVKVSRLNLAGLPVYADDTAAGTGGLVLGDVYQTATGELRIKL